jgi:hypothetical protein
LEVVAGQVGKTKEGVRQKMIGLGLKEQQQRKTGCCCSSDLPCRVTKEALSLSSRL